MGSYGSRCEEHVPRQPPLAREVIHDVKEALEVRERLLTLGRDELLAVALACAVPAPRDVRDSASQVLLTDELQAGGTDQGAVELEQREDEEPDRTAGGDLWSTGPSR